MYRCAAGNRDQGVVEAICGVRVDYVLARTDAGADDHRQEVVRSVSGNDLLRAKTVDLRCAFAQSGRHGIRVQPQVVGRIHSHRFENAR